MADSEKKGITKWWPFLGSIIVIVGIFKSYIFYSAFNINITDYLDLGEALLLFSRDVIPSAIFIILIIILGLSTRSDAAQKQADAFNSKIESISNFFERLKTYAVHHIVWVAPTILLGVFYIISLLIKPDITTFPIATFFWGFFLCFCFFVLVDELRIINNKHKFGNLTHRDQGWILLVLTLVVAAFINGRNDAYYKKYGEENIVYVWKLKGGTAIKTTKDTVYLGKTKGYIFLYAKAKGECVIYKTEDIQTTIIK